MLGNRPHRRRWRVPLADGRRVTVSTQYDAPGTPFPCLPPHTARERRLAVVHRGRDWTGELSHDHYLATDRPDAPARYVLWAADPVLRSPDGTTRIWPVAWARAVQPGHADGRVWADHHAAAILWYGWVLTYAAAPGDPLDCCGIEGGGLLTTEALDAVTEAAMVLRPLRLPGRRK